MFVDGFEREAPAPQAASCPGGMARQYRVQCYDASSQSDWKLHASFRDHWHAQQCLEDLQSRGIRARVIAHSSHPTAA